MSISDLPREIRDELRSLSEGGAEEAGRRLAAAAALLQDDPEAAYLHALAAYRIAGRVGAVREAVGLAAYAAGRYADAIGHLRAARRITGSEEYLPVLADSERGVGRPERALELAASPARERLDLAGRIELQIVAAGARRDLGQVEAALVALQSRDLVTQTRGTAAARLRYAYADALLAAGRREEAITWFERAAEADTNDETDAGERLADLLGVTFVVEPDAADPQPAPEPAPDAGPESAPGAARDASSDPSAAPPESASGTSSDEDRPVDVHGTRS